MRILGIETSCDDTSVAVYDSTQGLIIHKIYSQSKHHIKYGGVVPELAARLHVIYLSKLVKKVFTFLKKRNSTKLVDFIAYTAGPGLIGSLLVGATFGNSLAMSLGVPCILVNHLEGHLLSFMLKKKNYLFFPFLALLVSGGNTQLIYVKNLGNYKILGKTLDDSVGNVYDKIAKKLNLSYPGGKKLENLAKYGVKNKFYLPRPMIKDKNNFNFSFSGLKTCTENLIFLQEKNFQNFANIARSFEDAVIDTLYIKCKNAIKKFNLYKLVICGGVSSNIKLRNSLKNLLHKYNGHLFYSEKLFCTDNAAMIAYTAFLRFSKNIHIFSNNSILVNPNWEIHNSNFF